MSPMFLWRVGVDEYIIYIDDDNVIQEVSEDLVHVVLEDGS